MLPAGFTCILSTLSKGYPSPPKSWPEVTRFIEELDELEFTLLRAQNLITSTWGPNMLFTRMAIWELMSGLHYDIIEASLSKKHIETGGCGNKVCTARCVKGLVPDTDKYFRNLVSIGIAFRKDTSCTSDLAISAIQF